MLSASVTKMFCELSIGMILDNEMRVDIRDKNITRDSWSGNLA